MFCSWTLKDMGWSTAPKQMRPGGVLKLPFLHHHAKIPAQGGYLYTTRYNSCHVQKSMEDCHAQAAPQNLCPFPRVWPVCLLFFEFPYSPPCREVSLEHVLSLLHSFISEYSFCSPMAFATSSKGSTEESPTCWGPITHPFIGSLKLHNSHTRKML